MSKRNTEARDKFFTDHLDDIRVKEVFDLSHRDFCRLFYNNSQYDSLRAMGERFEELALREKGAYLASYYLITLQDLICSHIIANIGEELFNNHNFEVKVSKSCVQLTTECKQYLIHGLMGNPEVSTWLGVDNAPIEAIQNNNWKAIVFDLMNNAITAGPSFFIATSLIYDNIQAFEVHVKDTRENHQEKKYFEKILAKRNEVEEEDAFSFPSGNTVKKMDNLHNQATEFTPTHTTLKAPTPITEQTIEQVVDAIPFEVNPLASLETEIDNNNHTTEKNNSSTPVNQESAKSSYPNNRQKYSSNYNSQKKDWRDFKKSNTTSSRDSHVNNNSNTTDSKDVDPKEEKSNLNQETLPSSEKKAYPYHNGSNSNSSEKKPYYKKPYYKKNYSNGQSNESNNNANNTNETTASTETNVEKPHTKMKM